MVAPFPGLCPCILACGCNLSDSVNQRLHFISLKGQGRGGGGGGKGWAARYIQEAGDPFSILALPRRRAGRGADDTV